MYTYVYMELHVPGISSFYAKLCCTTIKPALTPMCQQASLQHHTAGLQSTAAVEQKAVKAYTNK